MFVGVVGVAWFRFVAWNGKGVGWNSSLAERYLCGELAEHFGLKFLLGRRVEWDETENLRFRL